MLDVLYHVSATAVPPAPSLDAAEYFELWSRVAPGGCAVLGEVGAGGVGWMGAPCPLLAADSQPCGLRIVAEKLGDVRATERRQALHQLGLHAATQHAEHGEAILQAVCVPQLGTRLPPGVPAANLCSRVRLLQIPEEVPRSHSLHLLGAHPRKPTLPRAHGSAAKGHEQLLAPHVQNRSRAEDLREEETAFRRKPAHVPRTVACVEYAQGKSRSVATHARPHPRGTSTSQEGGLL